MINIVKYTPEHFSQIKLRECFSKEVMNKDGAPSAPDGAMTFMLDNEPIAIVGGFFISHGVFQVWSLLSDSIKKKPLAFHRSIKLLIETWFDRLNLQRMQMTVKVGYNEGWRWAESLGFKSEGILRQYGPDGSDYWIFGRVS